MASACMAPTAERAKKAAGVDLPIVDTKRRRNAFRLVGPIEKMWRDGRIRDEQLAGFRKFERDMALTSPSKTLLARIGALPGGGIQTVTESVLDLRTEAFRNIYEIERWMEPRMIEALKAVVLNDVTLEHVGRTILMVGNKVQATTAAVETLRYGTWALALYYGYITAPDNAVPRPG